MCFLNSELANEALETREKMEKFMTKSLIDFFYQKLPVFAVLLKNYQLKVGTAASLICQVSAVPRAKVKFCVYICEFVCMCFSLFVKSRLFA